MAIPYRYKGIGLIYYLYEASLFARASDMPGVSDLLLKMFPQSVLIENTGAHEIFIQEQSLLQMPAYSYTYVY